MMKKRQIANFAYTTLGGGMLGMAWVLSQSHHFGCTMDLINMLSLLTKVSIGLVTFLAFSVSAQQYNLTKELKYLVLIGIRYLLAYKLVFFALTYTEGDFFNTSLTMQDIKVADMSPGQVVWNFMDYNKNLVTALGSSFMISALLLSFRKTAFWGSLLSFGLWGVLSGVNGSFGLCMLSDSLAMLSLSTFILIDDLPRVFKAVSGKQVLKNKSYQLLPSGSHLYRSLTFFKGMLIVGSMTYFANQIWRSQNYYQSNGDSPIVGVWDIIDLQYTTDTGEVINDTIPIELAEFKSLFLDKSRFGAVKVNEDSLSMFEYIVDSNYNQLEFWNFFDYRDLDLKGKYVMEDPDTLIYSAKNHSDSLRIVMRRNPRYKSRD